MTRCGSLWAVAQPWPAWCWPSRARIRCGARWRCRRAISHSGRSRRCWLRQAARQVVISWWMPAWEALLESMQSCCRAWVILPGTAVYLWSRFIPARPCWHCANMCSGVTFHQEPAWSCCTVAVCKACVPCRPMIGKGATRRKPVMNDALTPAQLRSLTPLNMLSEQQWRELRTQLVPQHVLAGQLLFRRGDQARTTYYLLSGELLLEDADGCEERLQAGSAASCHPLSPALPRV